MYLILKGVSIETNLSFSLHSLDLDVHSGIATFSFASQVGIFKLKINVSFHILDQRWHNVRKKNFEFLLNA